MKMHDVSRRSAMLAQSKTLKRLFELTCEYGGEPAALWLEDGNERQYTFWDYRRLSDDYAAYIAAHAPKGGYVGIALDTCKEWFPTFWGVIRSGHQALLLDASLPDERMRRLMDEAGCSTIITAGRRNLGAGVAQLLAGELFAAPRVLNFQPRYGDSVALCTSGTTGQSRVFVYSGEALAEQVLSSRLIYRENRRLVANANRRSLVFLPFHHVLGFVVNLLWCGFLGYANIYPADRRPETILETARRFQPELLVTVPLLANNLCEALRKKLSRAGRLKRGWFNAMKGLSLGLQSVAPERGLWLAEKVLFRNVLSQLLGTELKCVILGGSHTPAEHLRMLNALGYYTVCGFGMTETAITSVELSKSLRKRLSGSVGKPLRNVEYRVRPSDENRKRGEMLIRGQSIHTGRMSGGAVLPPDTLADGWYPTGDVVRLRKGGRVFVEGRLKEVIINESGENVYPDELEDVFAALEGVEQLCVLGIPRAGKGGRYEDIALVMNVRERISDEMYLMRLASEVAVRNSRLPSFKRLSRALVTREGLPVVNGIKVRRQSLRQLVQEGAMPTRELDLRRREAPPAAPEDETRQTVRRLFAQALDMAPQDVSDRAHFIDDLGGDSLQVLSLALQAEEAFGLTIPPECYGRCATVEDTVALVNELRAGTRQGPKTAAAPVTRFEDAPEYRAFQKRREALIQDVQDDPYFICHDSPLRDCSWMDGQEVLNFGSYNYVGMSGRPEVNAAAKDAIDRLGTSASGSRLLAGEKTLHRELERELAEWKHAEDALVLVGGHSTNVTLVGNFCQEGDLIVYDALAHNSVEQGCQLSRAEARPFPHNDARALERILQAKRAQYGKVLIIIEGAYSMDGDVADVPAFVELKKRFGCFLMVDEAHSACVIGQTGGGVDEYFGLAPDDVDIKMGTLSKGLGACGGYLAGRKCLIDYLRYNLPGFVFSVGLSPALAAAALCAVRLLRSDPSIMQNLRRNIDCFARAARRRRLDICLAGETAILPVLVGRDEDAFRLSNLMRRNGVFVPPAVYPAVPKNKARLRFCVISEHRPEQIERALDILLECAKELEIALPLRGEDA